MIRIGQKIEDFVFDLYQGDEIKTVKFSNYRGKWLVLLCYPGDGACLCPTELEKAAASYDRFAKGGAQILGVIMNPATSPGARRNFFSSIKQPAFPIATAPSERLSRYLGTYLEDTGSLLRGTFIIDPDGVLRARAIATEAVNATSCNECGAIQVKPSSHEPEINHEIVVMEETAENQRAFPQIETEFNAVTAAAKSARRVLTIPPLLRRLLVKGCGIGARPPAHAGGGFRKAGAPLAISKRDILLRTSRALVFTVFCLGATASQGQETARGLPEILAKGFEGAYRFNYLFVENGVVYLDESSHRQLLEFDRVESDGAPRITFFNQTSKGQKRPHYS
jgi:peroxiredoxin (alkyl hydroperoxide reductase subunit C)